jgi:hypothetical protein
VMVRGHVGGEFIERPDADELALFDPPSAD